jgi:hypothetical protein
MVHSYVWKIENIWLSGTLIIHNAVDNSIQVKFHYGVFHIYCSWYMALFLLENRDFLGFRIIIKVPLNQIFSIFHILWYAVMCESLEPIGWAIL